jgi:hypothetical protein
MEAMQQSWQAKKAAAALSCGAVTTTATAAKEALAAIEEDDEFTGITSQEEMDQVSAAVTECEHDKMIEGWVAEDEAVLEAAAVFQKNGGFNRRNTCPVGGCQDSVCGTCDSPRLVWDNEHSEMMHIERTVPATSDAVQVETKEVDSNERETMEELNQLQDTLQQLTSDETKGMQWETDCDEECAKSTAQQLQEEKEGVNRAKLSQWQNDKRTQQALAAKAAGKGKGGKGKGGKGKGGKGAGAGLLPAFVTENYHPPLHPLPTKKQETGLPDRKDDLMDTVGREEIGDGVCEAGPTIPSADALDLGDDAFPALGVSKKVKGVEVRKEVVSSGGSQTASMIKFMRKAYGCATPR